MGSEFAESREGSRKNEILKRVAERKKKQDAEKKHACKTRKRNNRCDESPQDGKIFKKLKNRTPSHDRWNETLSPEIWNETRDDSDRRGETPRLVHRRDEAHTPSRSDESPTPKTWNEVPQASDSDMGDDSATPGGSYISDWYCNSLTPDSRDETPTTEDKAMDLGVLNIPAILPFLKAICQSKDSWEARHKGIGFVKEIVILMGGQVLHHLPSIVDIIEPGLSDNYEMVRTTAALSVAALAKASSPCYISSFKPVIKPLLKGIKSHHAGKDLNAFYKAIGSIIPLMNAVNASYYTREVMASLEHDFDLLCNEERRKIVLKLIKRCVSTEGVETDYIRRYILPKLFHCFWVEQTVYIHSEQLLETTFEIAKKVGVADVVGRLAEDLKDESEPYRTVVMEAIEKIIANLGATDIDAHLEELLIDGILYAFKEQDLYDSDYNVVLNCFGTIVNLLGRRLKPYLPQICDTITCCLGNNNDDVRHNAADLISRIAVVLKQCEAQEFMGDLWVVLYENLAEECPEVLGSILGALKSIVNVSDATAMTPTIKNLLRKLTQILKNQHEKEVQENCIELVSLIADML